MSSNVNISVPSDLLAGAGIGGGIALVATLGLSLAVALFSDFISFGGLGSVGEQFSWRAVGRHAFKAGRILVPLGIVIGGVVSIFV